MLTVHYQLSIIIIIIIVIIIITYHLSVISTKPVG